MGRLFRALYERYRDRGAVLLGLLILWVVSIAVAVAVMTTGLAVLYLDLTSAEFVRLALVGNAAAITGIGVALAVSWRLIRPIVLWINDAPDRPDPEEAWRRILEFPKQITTRGIAIISVLQLAITAPYLVAEADLPAWGWVAAVLSIQVAVFFAWVLITFAIEFALRLVAEEIARELSPEVERPLYAWRLPVRTLLPIPAVAMTSGLITGAFAVEFSGPDGEGLIAASGAAVVVALLMTPLIKAAISDPLIRPVVDLKAGAERVAAGNLSSPVPVASGDELGALATSFNRMQLGLRERESLRSENVELVEEVRASRARIVAASDAERRRVERNLHDGAQQRLVAMALRLRMMEDHVGRDPKLSKMVAEAGHELSEATDDLRELARGLHPQVLSVGGLAPALEQLAERASIPVAVKAPSDRYPDPVESTAYFVVSEALANVAKYSRAKRAEVSAERRNGRLKLTISDDGVGGANPESGSGLTGLADRVAALDGRLSVESPPGQGTTVSVEIPLTQTGAEDQG